MIVNGDCIEVLRKITPVKCIFGDIPDNISQSYHGYNDKMGMKEYYDWIRLLIIETLPKCQVFWLLYNSIHDLEISYMSRDITKYRHPSFEVSKFIWTYTFSQYNDWDCAQGYRPMIRFKRSDARLYPDAIREVSKRQLLGDSRAAGERVPSNVWNIPRVTGNSHERCDWLPNQLPIKLLERVISFSVAGDEKFIDLFGGSGSALKAGLGLGLKNNQIIVVEIDEMSCEKMVPGHQIIKFDDGFDWSKI